MLRSEHDTLTVFASVGWAMIWIHGALNATSIAPKTRRTCVSYGRETDTESSLTESAIVL
jgi:hypothetical protein